MKSISTVLVGLLLTACSAIPIELRAPDPRVATSLRLSEFPGAYALLHEFDTRRGDTEWQEGDSVLFGLRLRKGEDTHRWLLRLAVVGEKISGYLDTDTDVAILEERRWSYTAIIGDDKQQIPIESGMRLIGVSVHDEHGKQLGTSLVKLPADLMSRGLLPGIECALAHQNAGGDFQSFATAADVRPMAEGLISLIALLDVVQNDSVLEDYFWQVVQKPSIWSVIAEFGVRATLTASLEKSVPVPNLPLHLPPTERAFAMPLRVDVNDNPALLADVIAVSAQRPFGLCGGIVAASARHPTDPSLTFDVQLLAARLASKAP